MATIKDIADQLHFSVSTISKGLNGASDISEKTRRLILDAAMKMGYIPKQSQRLGAGLTRICVFIENMDYEKVEQFGYDIILGFKLEAASERWDVSIVPLAMNRKSECGYEDYMRANHYAAGFLLGFRLHDDWLAQIERTNVPTVLLDNVVYRKNVACVGVDNQQGIFYAVEHLAGLSHRKIALLNGEADSCVSRERLAGFRLGMETCGLTVKKELVAGGDDKAEGTGGVVRKFIREGATAIVCASDLLAHRVLCELHRAGLRVPDEVSVTGFDDLPLASYTTPSLTTVRQDRLAIGKNVCKVLVQLLGGNSVSRLLLAPELVVRESTGRPKPEPGSKK